MNSKRMTWEEWVGEQGDSFWYQDGFKAASESGFYANDEYINELEAENKELKTIKFPKVFEEASKDLVIKHTIYGQCEQWFGEAAPVIEKQKETIAKLKEALEKIEISAYVNYQSYQEIARTALNELEKGEK